MIAGRMRGEKQAESWDFRAGQLLRFICLCSEDPVLQIFFFKILFIHERNRERGRDPGRGRSGLHAGGPMRDSIPGLQDHALLKAAVNL